MSKPPTTHSSSVYYQTVALSLVGLVVAITLLLVWFQQSHDSSPIRVGILHSLSGTMSISERSVAEATLMAISEINDQGGVLGSQIKAIVVDGQSDWDTFAREAERLIVEEKVDALFGCWTSACRKTVKSVIEKHQHLMFYPVQYEGIEQSPNIIYTGAAPNQQILPAVHWSMEHLGQRFFLVGSDYVFPRTANAIIKDQVLALRGEILGEVYIPLGSSAVQEAIEQIVQFQPDVILNTINGDSNLHFYKALRGAGISSEQIPTISFSIAEEELKQMGVHMVQGDYAAWNYFQTIASGENDQFVKAFKNRYGQSRVTSDPIEAGYFGVYLWAQAVQEAGTAKPEMVLKTIKNQSFNAPEGIVYLDPENNHTWKTVRIGRINQNAQFDIVWSSEKPVRPIPYHFSRSKKEWEEFLQQMYKGWNGNWALPQDAN